MLDNQSFSPRSHNVVHALPHVLRSLTFVLDGKFDPPSDLFDVGTHVSFAELDRLLEERHAVEVEKVEYFDWSK